MEMKYEKMYDIWKPGETVTQELKDFLECYMADYEHDTPDWTDNASITDGLMEAWANYIREVSMQTFVIRMGYETLLPDNDGKVMMFHREMEAEDYIAEHSRKLVSQWKRPDKNVPLARVRSVYEVAKQFNEIPECILDSTIYTKMGHGCDGKIAL